jgi:diguanylate cyclase
VNSFDRTNAGPASCRPAKELREVIQFDRFSGRRTGASRKPTLLVVSDQAAVLSEVAALAAEDFDVRAAADEQAARQALAAGEFDVLLADHALRPVTSLELLDWGRQHSPWTTGLLLARWEDAEQAGEALARGRVYACVLQPLRAEGLLPALRSAAGHSRRQWSWAALPGRACLWAAEAELLARQAAELEEDNRWLRRQALALECSAMTDPLTGLLNRRAIEAVAEYEVRRRERYPGALAVGLVDADHSREINHRHLLPGGDQALIGLARALAGSLRSPDLVGRVGGEEFLVVAPQTDRVGAGVLAERLRATAAEARVTYRGQAIPLTVSIGFAVAAAGVGADGNALRHLAAAALAAAKAAGRNRAVILQQE